MLRKTTITTAFALFLLAADTTFMSLVEYLDEYGALDFTRSMFRTRIHYFHRQIL